MDHPDQPIDTYAGSAATFILGVFLAELVFCTGLAAYFGGI